MFRQLTLSLSAAALFAGVQVASAQTVVYDALTNPATFTSTTSTPHTQLGQIFNLGSTTATAITGSDFLVAAQATATYTDVQVTQFFWATASGATTGTTAAYSTLLGSITYDLGAQSFVTNTVYTFNGGPNGFSSPVALLNLTTTAQIGFSELITANTGTGLALNNAVLPGFTTYTANAPAVGTQALAIGGIGAYYRNALSETNGNFVGSDARNLTSSVFIGVRLYAVPEPSTVAMFALAGGLTGGMVLRRRQA